MVYKPLTMTRAGETVFVTAVEAGHKLKTRLSSMGLLPGVEVRVVSNNARGPFIVAVGDTRLALGRGMAHKILVEPVPA